MAKVRHQFDSAGPLIGSVWPLEYRASDEELVATLRGFGVRRFSALPYAHKPGMAEFLNDWAFGFADRTPGCLRSATFYPEPEAAAYVAERVSAGAEIFKVHVQVGDFDVRDPLLSEVWGALEDAGTPVVVHAGSGPIGTPYTGPGPVADLLRAHPRLALVIAHLGAPEYADFLDLVAAYEHVRADTTMVFTPFFDRLGAAFPHDLVPRLARPPAQAPARLGLPEHPLPVRRAARRPVPAWTSATTGSATSAGTTAYACSGTRPRNPNRPQRVGPRRMGDTTQQGADRFRLGTLVPGEAGREADVIS